MEEYILETDNITKKYGAILAVDHVSIRLKRGEIYGLIGRNGAGKTTLLKMLAGLAKPTEGTYRIFGEPEKKTAKLRDRIGVLIEGPGLIPNMSAMENMKVKAMIALALESHPDLLLLDEPINGLDPQGIVDIRELIERLSKERNITILISSHILEELSKIATRYGILHHGRMIDEFTHKELLRRCSERIELRPSDSTRAVTVIEAMGITDYKVMDTGTIQIFERLDDSGEIVLELAKNNIKTLNISVKNEALEDYYLSITGDAAES